MDLLISEASLEEAFAYLDNITIDGMTVNKHDRISYIKAYHSSKQDTENSIVKAINESILFIFNHVHLMQNSEDTDRMVTGRKRIRNRNITKATK